MFKPESYITPILLSYVDKYIKNFRLEDSQVSLWGGDASFHNLDLRLEVLENELQLPFSFVSGHIHELLIHVPWIKLTSEPITVTINTIECILKLKGREGPGTQSDTSLPKEKKRPSQRDQLEPPPTYVQSIINKIVGNISIYCNNLILKYVEEDIVLSMNVKHLKFESANDKWEPQFMDIPTGLVMVRKLIGLNDLTVCLDKRNAAGKIDVYQEPMLYRCSMTMHLMRTYHTATANKSSVTRLDIFCDSMEFSMTEQQVPMLMRLLLLLYTLQQQKLKINDDAQSDAPNQAVEARDALENADTWTGWAWSYVTSVLPTQWEEEWDNVPFMQHKCHSFHMGIYVDEMSIVFKVSDMGSGRTFYPQRKIRYVPVMALHLQGIYLDTKLHGIEWANVSGGVSSILLMPVGFCTCGEDEGSEKTDDPQPYLKVGISSVLYRADSLFDDEALENRGQNRSYNTDWDFHITTQDESVLLERTSAFAFDYVYCLDLPSDMSPDALSELGSDFEYSNLREKSSIRVCFGPLTLQLCAGFFHRFDSLRVAGSVYEYAPYVSPKSMPSIQDLLPPSEEDYDALSEYIAMKTLRVTFFNPVIEMHVFDHPTFMPTVGNLFRKHADYSSRFEQIYFTKLKLQPFLPKLTIACQLVDISYVYPIYENRLIHTTCQLPDPPKQLFDACYVTMDVKLLNVNCKLILNPSKQTTVVMPFGLSYRNRNIIKPQYWVHPDITHDEVTVEMESFTCNATRSKQMIIYHLLEETWTEILYMMGEGKVKFDRGNLVGSSTLIVDSFRDYAMPCLELCVENLQFRAVTTESTYSVDVSLGSVRGFIFERVAKTKCRSVDISEIAHVSFESYDIQQVLFISGPEPKADGSLNNLKRLSEDNPLFTATLQYPLTPDLQAHPSILLFNLQEIRICVDPLFCKWFLYVPRIIDSGSEYDAHHRAKSTSEASSSARETPRRAQTLRESIHSSSDRETPQICQRPPKNQKEDSVDLQEKIYNFLKSWFNVWKGMLLCGDISQCTIYFPIESLSAVGSQGIQEAVDYATNKQSPPDILVITLPLATVRSAQRQSITKFLKNLPVTLPENIWSLDKSSFPWTMSISDLSCYTIQFGNKLIFLKPVSLNATVGLSTRPSKTEVKDGSSDMTLESSSGSSSKADIGCLGVCVHIDMTPVVVATSEVQMYLLASILYGLLEVYGNLIQPPFPARPKAEESHPSILKDSPVITPPIFKESTVETLSESSVPLSTAATQSLESETVKLTAWVQWTITRFTIELLSSDAKLLENVDCMHQSKLKLVIDAEDIVSSLDFQSVYLKIKSKVGLVSVQHYKRKSPNSKWKPGSFSGIVMRLREDVVTNDRHEDNGFISLTVTRASCQHTHTLWGAMQKKKKDKKSSAISSQLLMPTRYITEIVVNVQPIDLIISLRNMKNFYLIVQPLLNLPLPNRNTPTKSDGNVFYNNQNMPLAYLDCQDIRIIMPTANVRETGLHHDALILQVHRITLNPTAVNPICRTPSRPDIYQQAAQARLLNVPGSEVEDRQYQLDIAGLSISSGLWDNLEASLTSSSSIVSSLHGASENPALEWNNLEQGHLSINPVLHLWQIAEKFDITVVFAPAMVFRKNILICGNSTEVNLVTDIFMNISLSQIKLMAGITDEFCDLFQPPAWDPQVYPHYMLKIPYRFDLQYEEDSDIDLIEVLRDSGIDTSDIRSLSSIKVKHLSTSYVDFQPLQQPCAPLPQITETVSSEVLFTAGKIVVCLYECEMTNLSSNIYRKKQGLHSHKIPEDLSYDASEENSIADEAHETVNKFLPLLHLSLSQPNVYSSKYHLGDRFQVTCFDVDIRVSSPQQIALRTIPTETDFEYHFVETRSGKPNAATGILPAFFTLKYFKTIGKPAFLDVEVMKPTKVMVSAKLLCRLLHIQKLVLGCVAGSAFMSRSPPYPVSREVSIADNSDTVYEHYKRFHDMKELFRGVSTVNVGVEQLVFSLVADGGTTISLNVGKAYNHLTICNRPERISNVTTVKCVTLSARSDNFTKVLMNPWSLSVETCLYWESWQDSNSSPQIQVVGDTDSLNIDISQEHIKCLQTISKEASDFMSSFPCVEQEEGMRVRQLSNVLSISTDKEQHYKDDLRAGAFQFVNSNLGNNFELPLPYQVVFSSDNGACMAWKYPQPRALTKVRIFPVPYKLTQNDYDNTQVLCHLEYWSDCHNTYLPYTQFFLSESEILDLPLPDEDTYKIVACTWRVVLKTPDESGEFSEDLRAGVSPRALAACMRIDSYFNKTLVPNLMVALKLSRIQISLYTYFDKTAPAILPKALRGYSSDLLFPETHCFSRVIFENIHTHLSSWKFNRMMLDVTLSTKCSVVDYAFLTKQPLLDAFTSRLDVGYSDHVTCKFAANPVSVKFCPGIAHTLAVSAQLWAQSFTHSDETTQRDFIIMTRYVICNDTDSNLRFGQHMTDEDVLLPPKYFNMYCWRSQKQKHLIKVGLEQAGWVWSEPFSIEENGTQIVSVDSENNLKLVVTVKSLSATQKQIILSGQLAVSNMLLEHFELKVVEAVETDRDKQFKSAPIHIVAAKSVTPSIFINTGKKYFLRLRFFRLDSAWTGDIPLAEHTKGAQPWLVKVPLQERGQFLSIWCRVIVQDFRNGKKILVMLWPLFAIRSNLPVDVKVDIQTEALKINRADISVSGRGEIQQLYCPGTIEHAHQLTFRLDDGTITSESHVPLSYSLIDQENFFQKADNEDIDEILEVISKYNENAWPYFGEELEPVEWVTEDQPLTYVQVRYENACLHSSTLLIELLPWCLMVNVFGYPISILVSGVELCRLPHNGIVAPPKLEDTFNLLIGMGESCNLSCPLQLAKSNWSQTFYMPTITGSVPLDGTIKTPVSCKTYVSMVSISSQIQDEIRLLKLASTHVLTNCLNMQVHVICYAVPLAEKLYDIPSYLRRFSFAVSPHLDKSKSGISIIQWYLVDKYCDLSGEFALYISLSLEPNSGWSCPLRVDDKVPNRRSIGVGKDNDAFPIVVTCQEYKGQMFVNLHHDTRPQTCIDNKSEKSLFCAQLAPEGEVIPETNHFAWHCKLKTGTVTYYTMPSLSERFPELPQATFAEQLVFSCGPQGGGNKEYRWSDPISLTSDTDQFLRIPASNDVRVVVRNTACTTYVLLESVSKVEISAKDIRVRLSKHEREVLLDVDNKTDDQKSDVNSQAFANNVSTPGPYSVTSLPQSTLSIPQSTSDTQIQDRTHRSVSSQSRSMVRMAQNTLRGLSETNVSQRRFRSESDIRSGQAEARVISLGQINSKGNLFEVSAFLSSFSITFIAEKEATEAELNELGLLTCDNIAVIIAHGKLTDVAFSISDIQFDNQAYSRASYDFPVVLIGQKAKVRRKIDALNTPIDQLLNYAKDDAVLDLKLVLESCENIGLEGRITGIKDVRISIQPLSCFLEDIFLNNLNDYLYIFMPSNLIMWPEARKTDRQNLHSISVFVPELVLWQSEMMSRPLTIRTIVIEPVSLMISLHCTVKIYVALDQSPLEFRRFERKRLFTLSYRLGHALAMQYMSSAIFGAGWVVGSLELLGSPGGFARTMGAGLRDFVSLPYQGLVQGPWAFLIGITHGSASLMKHVTAGTLQSVTKMASSIARNFDKLTMDEEHVRRAEEQRRQKPQGLAQGLVQGFTGLGISLLGGIGGLAHHPLQSVMSESASARNVVKGVGLGLVGIFTKPLSSAAELVALAGQGLLQGAGWTSLPTPRASPTVFHIFSCSNTPLKYKWKLTHAVSHANLLYVAEATSIAQNNIYSAVALILTTEALTIFNTDQDTLQRVISLSEINLLECGNDPTVLAFKLTPPPVTQKISDEDVVEMDPACRARVADYVRNTVGILHLTDKGSGGSPSDFSISPLSTPAVVSEDAKEEPTVLRFYVNPLCRNYFLCLLSLAKQQNHNYNFPVL